MRERYLFRGFHPCENGTESVWIEGKDIKGEWVYGNLIHRKVWNSEFVVIRCDDSGFDNYTDFEVLSETVGQCTGLCDKNGTRIFEGDLLQGDAYPFCHDGEYNYFAEVLFFENSPAFGIYTFKNPKSNVRGISTGNCSYMEDFEPEIWQVIGNKFSNPDLLQ